MLEVRSLLPLDSPEWQTLQHAYGPAADLPALLKQLSSFPPEDEPRAEPWFRLWSCLCHQGDVFSASFAAVPHIVNAAASAPERTSPSYMQLPVEIELARLNHRMEVPARLADAYWGALHHLRAVAGSILMRELPAELRTVALAAAALAQRQPAIARLLLEVDEPDIDEVLKWYQSR